MKGIWETMIDQMGNHTLSDQQRAELSSWHGHVPAFPKNDDDDDLMGAAHQSWIQRSPPGIQSHHH